VSPRRGAAADTHAAGKHDARAHRGDASRTEACAVTHTDACANRGADARTDGEARTLHDGGAPPERATAHWRGQRRGDLHREQLSGRSAVRAHRGALHPGAVPAAAAVRAAVARLHARFAGANLVTLVEQVAKLERV
jgi:hypothetical protein